MNVGDTVRLVDPQCDDEAAARFTLIERNGDRGFIRLICDLPIPPVELVRIEDVVVAAASRSRE